MKILTYPFVGSDLASLRKHKEHVLSMLKNQQPQGDQSIHQISLIEVDAQIAELERRAAECSDHPASV